MANDAGGGDGGDGRGVVGEGEDAAGLAVAVAIDGAAEEVGEAGGVEGDAGPGAGGEGFEVEEGGLFPVGGKLDAGEDFHAAEVGVEARGIEGGTEGERDGELEDGLAGEGDIALAGERAGEADGGERQRLGRAGLEDFFDEFVAVGVVDEAVLVQVGEKR